MIEASVKDIRYHQTRKLIPILNCKEEQYGVKHIWKTYVMFDKMLIRQQGYKKRLHFRKRIKTTKLSSIYLLASGI